jgi:hypothetical protein
LIVNLHPADVRYGWRELDPSPFGSDTDWSHHGLAINSSGAVVGFSQATRALVQLRPSGEVVSTTRVPVGCAHGITAVIDGLRESYWIADIGIAATLHEGVVVRDVAPSGVVNLASDGALIQRLDRPMGSLYQAEAAFLPTSIAVHERRHGGSGEVWVADGYGQSIVHRYSAGGDQLAALDGTSGAGRFDCPHSVFIDRRRTEPELLIADRANHRVQVFDLDGRFRRSFGQDYLISPSAFATIGETLVIGDLRARLTLVDIADRLIRHLGDGGAVYTEPGWPNLVATDGQIARRPFASRRFSSPHGLAATSEGAIYVAEWRIGGRVVRLAPHNLTDGEDSLPVTESDDAMI